MNCSASISEQENDRRQGLLELLSPKKAARDWAAVQQKAAVLLSGNAFLARRLDTFLESGVYVSKMRPVRFDMGDVIIAVYETDGFKELLTDQVNGVPNAADAVSDLTRMKAHEVAFYALDLDESWANLQDLIGEAVK